MKYTSEEQKIMNIFIVNKTENTIRTYLKELDNFKSWFSNKEFCVVSSSDAKTYVSHLKYEKKLAERTIKRIVRTLMKYYDTGIKENIFTSNPFYTVELPPERTDYIDRRQLLTIDELQKLLVVAKNSCNRDYAIVMLLITSRFTALELDNLCWGDIRYDTLSRWYAEVKTRGMNRTRAIPLRDDVVGILGDYRHQLGLGNIIDNDRERNCQIFLNRYGKPISETGVRKIIYRLCRLAGVKSISPMDLSHLCMGLARVSGATDLQLTKQAGFSNVSVTNKYKIVNEILEQPACNMIKLPEH